LDVVPDSIERELILPVPRERVWAALTQSRSLGAWFGTRATVDLRPGGAVTFIWDDSSGAQFTNTGVIEVVEPPRRFAFRWHAHDGQHAVAPADGPTTLVEFTLDDHPAGTRLRLVESGFASLPTDFGRGPARDRNIRGWDRELAELAVYLADVAEG
jgi:uncharacterized protein YndB with AHSA1/START domain